MNEVRVALVIRAPSRTSARCIGAVVCASQAPLSVGVGVRDRKNLHPGSLRQVSSCAPRLDLPLTPPPTPHPCATQATLLAAATHLQRFRTDQSETSPAVAAAASWLLGVAWGGEGPGDGVSDAVLRDHRLAAVVPPTAAAAPAAGGSGGAAPIAGGAGAGLPSRGGAGGGTGGGGAPEWVRQLSELAIVPVLRPSLAGLAYQCPTAGSVELAPGAGFLAGGGSAGAGAGAGTGTGTGTGVASASVSGNGDAVLLVRYRDCVLPTDAHLAYSVLPVLPAPLVPPVAMQVWPCFVCALFVRCGAPDRDLPPPLPPCPLLCALDSCVRTACALPCSWSKPALRSCCALLQGWVACRCAVAYPLRPRTPRVQETLRVVSPPRLEVVLRHVRHITGATPVAHSGPGSGDAHGMTVLTRC